MAYSALELMEKANRIYEIEEMTSGKQLTCFLIWTIECCLILALVLYIIN
ncbi:MAG: hypothetical protein JRG97_15700 [Deltaproteobacteria bacterium]|nr:hypothetical protein [Deltaproteobacteria bacterium]MBW2142478.1 hypothetical protein [Deltaproteobacteria bacterium]